MIHRTTIWLLNIANWKIHYKWGFIAGKNICFYGPFSIAMFNNQRLEYIYIIWDIYIYIYGYWGITVPPGTGLFICFDSFNSPVPMQTCTHFNIYINKNTTILKAWIQKTLQTLQSFLDSRFKILRETFWIPSLGSGWGKSERMILIQKVSPRILNLESRRLGIQKVSLRILNLESRRCKSRRGIWIQKVSPRILNLESRKLCKLCKVFWIQDSRFKILRETVWIPRLGSGWGKSERIILIQKFLLESWILNPGGLGFKNIPSESWIQEM